MNSLRRSLAQSRDAVLPLLPHQGSGRVRASNGHLACQWDCVLACVKTRCGKNGQGASFPAGHLRKSMQSLLLSAGTGNTPVVIALPTTQRRRGAAAMKSSNENNCLQVANASAADPLAHNGAHFIQAKAC